MSVFLFNYFRNIIWKFFLYFQGKVCGDEHTVDLSKYKALLSMAKGHIVIDSNIEHDTVSNLLDVYIWRPRDGK